MARLDARAVGIAPPEYDDLEVVIDLLEGAVFKLSHVVRALVAETKQAVSAEKLRRIRLEEAGGRYTKSQILLLLHNQRYRCAYARSDSRPPWCRGRIGFNTCHHDHVKPLARRGTNWISNIQLTCAPCNQRKHAKDPIGFAQDIGLLL